MNPLLTPVFADGGGLLFFLLFAVFGLIKFLTAKKEGEGEAPSAPASADEERRTREIQEEIRRRIAENMKKAAAPSAPAQARPAAQRAELHPDIRSSAPRQTQPTRVETRGPSLMERLAQARREEAESQKRIETTLASIKARQKATGEPATARGAAFTDAAAMLNSGAGLRESIILSEILGGPVSDRSTPSCPGLR
jgi:hypothetical protein